MTNRKRIWKWNARKNADRFYHPGGPQARQKASRRDAQPAPARGCSRGLGGAATNKQNERPAGRRDVHFSHDGTIMPCLPVSPASAFPRHPSPTPKGHFRRILRQNHLFPARNTPTTPDTIPLAGPSDNLGRKRFPAWYDWRIITAPASRFLPPAYLHPKNPRQLLHPRPANTPAVNQNMAGCCLGKG